MAFSSPFPTSSSAQSTAKFDTPFPAGPAGSPPAVPAKITPAPKVNPFSVEAMGGGSNQPLVTPDIAPAVAQSSSTKVPTIGFPATQEAFKEFTASLKPSNLFDEKTATLKEPNYGQMMTDVWSALKTPVMNEAKNIKDYFNANSFKDPSISKNLGAGLRTIAGAGDIIFSPISALFAGAKNVPILAPIAKAIALPFTAIGEAGAGMANELIDKLPISNQAKEQIAPGVQQIFALAGQIALGEVFDPITKIKELKSRFSTKDAEVIVDTATKLGEQRKEALANEPIQPHPLPEVAAAPITEPFPVSDEIKAVEQPKAPSGLPTIEPVNITLETKVPEIRTHIESLEEVVNNSPLKRLAKYESKSRPGELPEVTGERGRSIFKQRGDQLMQEIASELGHPEWGVQETADAYSKWAQSRNQLTDFKAALKLAKGDNFIDYTPAQLKEINSMAQSTAQSINDTPGRGGLAPVEGTGEIKTRGLSKSVETKTIEDKLTKGFGDLPEYRQVSMKDQAARANDIINNNYEQAKRIAMGEELPPKDVLASSVYVALAEHANLNGDVALIRDLAMNSKITEQGTTAGQFIRAFGELDPESPVGAIQEVVKAREDAINKKYKDVNKVKDATIKDIKESIKKTAPTKETWRSFVDSITC